MQTYLYVSHYGKQIFVNNRYIDLNSGMSVIAEAKTGDRRIIDFFLTPVKKSIEESLKEK